LKIGYGYCCISKFPAKNRAACGISAEIRIWRAMVHPACCCIPSGGMYRYQMEIVLTIKKSFLYIHLFFVNSYKRSFKNYTA